MAVIWNIENRLVMTSAIGKWSLSKSVNKTANINVGHKITVYEHVNGDMTHLKWYKLQISDITQH